MSNIEAIKRKIEALLAKANDTSVSEAEADAFNRKAHELMTKYNIERAELGVDQPVERASMDLVVQLRPWSAAVLGGITRLYYCTYFSRKLDAKGRKHKVTLVGEKQNVMVAHAIAVMVLRSIQSEARASGDGRSFMTGAGYRVAERCQQMTAHAHSNASIEATKQLADGSTGNALVILDKQESEANYEFIRDTMGIRLAKGKPSKPRVNSGEAFRRGQSHGDKVQLRRNLLGNG